MKFTDCLLVSISRTMQIYSISSFLMTHFLQLFDHFVYFVLKYIKFWTSHIKLSSSLASRTIHTGEGQQIYLLIHYFQVSTFELFFLAHLSLLSSYSDPFQCHFPFYSIISLHFPSKSK